MATSPTSVVTPQRYAQGLTYQQFLAQAKVNPDKFQHYYETMKLSREDTVFFERVVQAGAKRVLALAEDWCPDVFRGLPVLVRIAEATGMELRVFPRDANLDIMDQFLLRGQFRSIPTFVLYTGQQEYLCHWIERPDSANEDRARVEEDVKRKMPSATMQTPEFRQAIYAAIEPLYPAWQQATVKELRNLLASRLSIR
jgi:thiol-disulfide isomerase/thioredoxin